MFYTFIDLQCDTNYILMRLNTMAYDVLAFLLFPSEFYSARQLNVPVSLFAIIGITDNEFLRSRISPLKFYCSLAKLQESIITYNSRWRKRIVVFNVPMKRAKEAKTYTIYIWISLDYFCIIVNTEIYRLFLYHSWYRNIKSFNWI